MRAYVAAFTLGLIILHLFVPVIVVYAAVFLGDDDDA